MIEFYIDCRVVRTTNDLHAEIKKNLDFPSFYGSNFSALNDSLGDFLISHSDKGEKTRRNHLVFSFIFYEKALLSIGEEDFNIFLDFFNRNIDCWKAGVDAEVRLVK